jgi:hypothetical protein
MIGDHQWSIAAAERLPPFGIACGRVPNPLGTEKEPSRRKVHELESAALIGRHRRRESWQPHDANTRSGHRRTRLRVDDTPFDSACAGLLRETIAGWLRLGIHRGGCAQGHADQAGSPSE